MVAIILIFYKQKAIINCIGFMISHYTAAALGMSHAILSKLMQPSPSFVYIIIVSEKKVLTHPSTVDSITVDPNSLVP